MKVPAQDVVAGVAAVVVGVLPGLAEGGPVVVAAGCPALPLTARAPSAAAALPRGTGYGGVTGFIQAASNTGASLGPDTAGSAAMNWPAAKNHTVAATTAAAATPSTAHACRDLRRARR
ncbi:hypothetical protein ARGLB_074_00150 [Arthrobacter globiformis NBRC 12137]|uniref:Uncharacterized protein n=1 Tax=Arthrobacter globiformis (strain ATCC 8010 / DSM 20124 / JCM 1332 / NBRC 12137 / NCIMB 8907 / NRRL B-2979 / 168) TaxID=1077972 RepID=H0QPB6_ARTG1|nr:hypothetical protein ARGLB_074_00150 [Arthrobacter globiformis NBRC 12137]